MKTNTKKLVGLALLAAVTVTAVACSQEAETLKPLGGGGSDGGTAVAESPAGQPEQPDDSPEGSPTTTGNEGRPADDIESDSAPPELASRPADITSQDWWRRSDVMKWWFGEPATDAVRPETLIGVWSNPANSDGGDPEAARQLAEAGKSGTAEWLTTNPPGQIRGVLPPAVNVTFQGAAAAKAYRMDGGPQLYRVAVLWSAEQDREFRRPTYNQMLEMYFSGTPGNWTRVPCEDAGPSMCVPIFQTII